MSFEEEFSLVEEQVPEMETEEGLRKLVGFYQEKQAQLLAEHTELEAESARRRTLTADFAQRSEKLRLQLMREQQKFQQQVADGQDTLARLDVEQRDLALMIQEARAALAREKDSTLHLRQQAQVLRAAPEREVVFQGRVSDVADGNRFHTKASVLYPMDGGTALVTFEEEEAALKILDMKLHTVSLGDDCRITVEARPVHLLLPRRVRIHTQVSHRNILVSDLPDMDPEMLLSKLENHFSKSRNGGGEVESCELLPDSGAVVITFVSDRVSAQLTQAEFHTVPLAQKQPHRVRVTPFMKGELSDLQCAPTPCPRTLLLTGIPDVMDREGLQDMLEIHFQKSGNGGGEIEAILYNPIGQEATARFQSVAEE